MTPQLQLLLDKLTQHGYNPKLVGDEYRSHCPGHSDEHPSLDVCDGNTRVLLTCRSNGCLAIDIVTPLGLTLKDLHYNPTSDNKPAFPKEKKKNAFGDGAKKEKVLSSAETSKPQPTDNKEFTSKRNYKNLAEYAQFKGFPLEIFTKAKWSDFQYFIKEENRKVASIKIPVESGFTYRILDNSASGRFRRNKGFEQCFYGLTRALSTIKSFERENKKSSLILCNGEPSTVIAQYCGLPAFALCANETADFRQELLEQLIKELEDRSLPKEIILCLDNDSAGAKGTEKRKQSLEKAGFEVIVIDFVGKEKGYDLADFCKEYKESNNLYEILLTFIKKKGSAKEENLGLSNENESDNVIAQNGKPTVFTHLQQSEILTQVQEILVNSNNPPTLFRQGSRLIRINEEIIENNFIVEDADYNVMNGIMIREANWVKLTTKGQMINDKPPSDIVKDLITNPPLEIPPVDTIILTPTFDQNNNLISQTGYNKQSRCFLPKSKVLLFSNFNPNPSETHVLEALNLLENELFCDFPFATPSDYANTLATLLEQFIKFQIEGTRPLRAIEAATPGTGKGLLVRVIGLVCFGREIEATTIPEDRAEWGKLITSLLMEMPEAIFFDNIGKTLQSPDLDAVLTTNIWKRRLLHSNKNIECHNRALWLATGNNITYGGDLLRRVVPIRLVAKQEDPSRRHISEFKHPNLTKWVIQHRVELVLNCLTIVQYWINQGKPQSPYMLGSFESWSSNLGGLLSCIGVNGFLDNLKTTHTTSDPYKQQWSDFVNVWQQKFDTNPVKVSELLELCEIYEIFAFSKDDSLTLKGKQTKLGSMLRNYRDRIFNGYQIIHNSHQENHLSRNTYQLKPIK